MTTGQSFANVRATGGSSPAGRPDALAERSLPDLELVVERGLPTFLEVGQALAEIRDRRLYRERYGTFENYCRERWGWSRQHAYRQMKAANLVAGLSPTGDIPENERQARALLNPVDELQTAVGLLHDAVKLADSMFVYSDYGILFDGAEVVDLDVPSVEADYAELNRLMARTTELVKSANLGDCVRVIDLGDRLISTLRAMTARQRECCTRLLSPLFKCTDVIPADSGVECRQGETWQHWARRLLDGLPGPVTP